MAKGLRFNKNKLNLSYCPISAICAIAMVFAKNSESYGGKYPDNNWRLGQPLSNHLNSLLRHIFKFMSGEDIDKESNLPHLYHAITNLAMAIEDLHNNPDLDDRFKEKQATFEEFQQEFLDSFKDS